MAKAVKTNAMRILDRAKIKYTPNFYDCNEFTDAVKIADMLEQRYENSFKTLVTEGKSKAYYVFVLPIAEELDLKKAARTVGEKSVEMIHVKDIRDITGYIRGGCTPIGMKKKYPTVIHSSVNEFDEVIVSGGMIGAQLILSPADLIKAANATVADIIAER